SGSSDHFGTVRSWVNAVVPCLFSISRKSVSVGLDSRNACRKFAAMSYFPSPISSRNWLKMACGLGSGPFGGSCAVPRAPASPDRPRARARNDAVLTGESSGRRAGCVGEATTSVRFGLRWHRLPAGVSELHRLEAGATEDQTGRFVAESPKLNC